MVGDEPLKIVAAVLDLGDLILYENNGRSHYIPQGDHRIEGLVAVIIPEIRSKGFAMVTLDSPTTIPNIYSEYEKKTGGLTKFFRIARSKLKSIFGVQEAQPVRIQAVGDVPQVLADGASHGPEGSPSIPIPVMAASDRAVVDEIIANAKPASTPKFAEGVQTNPDLDKAEGETIVAITKDTVVPNVQNLDRHIAQANETNTVGMQRFIERMGKMYTVKKRGHTIEDLLQFMKHGDLPIADDGSIIIYKVLKLHGHEGDKRTYVDSHTKKVIQRVGSRVFMAEKLVDPSRHQDCSDGLHVAQRSYLGGFHGDVCILGRVFPEDVIAVPKYSTNKMRACSYDILAELSPEAHQRLRNNKPIDASLPRDLALIAMAIRGEFPPYDQLVEIQEPMGGKIKITNLKPGQVVQPATETPATAPEQVTALPDTLTLPEAPQAAPVVSPKAVQAAIDEDKKVMPPTRSQIVQNMWNEYVLDPSKEKAEAILAFKRKAKVSWFNLGFKESPEETLVKKIKE